MSREVAALPDEIAGEWGYSRMTAYAGIVVPERHARRHEPADLPWLSHGVIIDSRLGTTATTATGAHAVGLTRLMALAAQYRPWGRQPRHSHRLTAGYSSTATGSGGI